MVMNLVGLVYPNTAANVCSLTFFINSVFSWGFPFLNTHVVCQKLQLFRSEQAQEGCCTTFAFCVASLLSEVLFHILYMWIWATTIFFMVDYLYFIYTIGMNSPVGLRAASYYPQFSNMNWLYEMRF
jgi:hypothetical protein